MKLFLLSSALFLLAEKDFLVGGAGFECVVSSFAGWRGEEVGGLAAFVGRHCSGCDWTLGMLMREF